MEPLDRTQLQHDLADLAGRGVYVGTSSWKYPGWCGQIYDESRYLWRGRFSEGRFERLCLGEYASVFPTVSVDASYYKFPTVQGLEVLTGQVPPGFRFSLKVTDEITVRKFPNLPRFGARAGQMNRHFLNADLFTSAFVEPCTPFRPWLGLIMFEFSHFYPSDFARGREFVAALDTFLGALPGGWDYGVEIRNRNFLHPDYFAMLARHRVAHVYNSWDDMPPVTEQLTLPGSRTVPDLLGARFLLRPGRSYENAVQAFAPYDRVRDVNPEGRAAGAQLIRQAVESGIPTRAFVYVNNRFEGNSPLTIRAMIDLARGTPNVQ